MIKKYWLRFIVILFAVLSVLTGLLYLGWSNTVGLTLAAGLHLPALEVNQTKFTVTDVMADIKAINTAPDTKDLTVEEKNAVLGDKLKQEGVINSLVRELKLEIHSSDISDLQRQLLTGADAKSLSEAQVRQTFGYSLKDFTKRVAIPYYNRLQLQKYFILNTDNDDKAKISKLRELVIKQPEDFDTKAKELSGQDPLEHIVLASDLTGDYAHISSLPIGGISAIVANADGYRLYRVINIISDDKQGTYYQLHELFVPTTIFQQKLNEALAKVTEHWYIKKPQVIAVR